MLEPGKQKLVWFVIGFVEMERKGDCWGQRDAVDDGMVDFEGLSGSCVIYVA